MTSLSISTLYLNFSAPTDWIYLTFGKHYNGFTINHIPKFRPRKFFSASYQRKKNQIKDFLESIAYIFESCIDSTFGIAIVFALTYGRTIGQKSKKNIYSWEICSFASFLLPSTDGTINHAPIVLNAGWLSLFLFRVAKLEVFDE